MTDVAAIVLAAGTSSRIAGGNKLLADLGGEPVLRRTVSAILASSARPVIVVTGHEAEAVGKVVEDLPVILVRNLAFAQGMATSLVAGIAALPPDVSAALICLGDMPLVRADIIDVLIAAHVDQDQLQIAVPVHKGRRGHPVLWGRGHFADLQMLSGDQGARSLMQRNEHNVMDIETGDDSIFADADTPAALAELRARI